MSALGMMHACSKAKRGLFVGFTLIEMLTVTTILSALILAALATYKDLIIRQRLLAASRIYVQNLGLAKSHAMLSQKTVVLSFKQGESGSCYVFYTGTSGDCECGTTKQICKNSGNTLIAHEHIEKNSGISIELIGQHAHIKISPHRNTFTPTLTLKIKDTLGNQINHITNIIGRTRVCSTKDGTLGVAPC